MSDKTAQKLSEDTFLVTCGFAALRIQGSITPQMLKHNVHLPVDAITLQMLVEGFRLALTRLTNAGSIDVSAATKAISDIQRITQETQNAKQKTKH